MRQFILSMVYEAAVRSHNREVREHGYWQLTFRTLLMWMQKEWEVP